MDTEMQALLAEVEAYLTASGMGPAAFGKRILNDGHAVTRMRDGKAITSKNMSLIRRFMSENPPGQRTSDAPEAAA
jgi:hypothetical protein